MDRDQLPLTVGQVKTLLSVTATRVHALDADLAPTRDPITNARRYDAAKVAEFIASRRAPLPLRRIGMSVRQIRERASAEIQK